jgi:hypothetical protein
VTAIDPFGGPGAVSPPSLDVVCVTRDDPARVAAIIGDLAPFTSDVLLAVDRRVPVETLGPYAALTDRVHRFDAHRGADVARNWLLDRSAAEWALVIDGDEVVSDALVRTLPELLAADVGQHVIARRWCYPTVDTWLGEQPWWPDFQVRLLRRARWRPRRFGVLPHEGVRVLPPVSFQLAPIYHLDAVISSRDERVAKAAAYERLRPGIISPGGDALNATLFVPEDHPVLPLRATPAVDVDRLCRVLEAVRSASGTGALPDVVDIDDRELDAYFPELARPDDDYRAGLAPVDQELRLAPGEVWNLYLEVENRGTQPFPGGGIGDARIALSYRMVDRHGQLVVSEGPRTPLPAPLAPGARAIAPMRVDAPAEPGPYVVHVDLVHDGARWFGATVAVPLWVGDRASRPTG